MTAVFGQLDWPQARRTVAIDDGHERAALRFVNQALHAGGHDEVLLFDHALDFERVDFGQSAIGRIGQTRKKSFGLPTGIS